MYNKRYDLRLITKEGEEHILLELNQDQYEIFEWLEKFTNPKTGRRLKVQIKISD